MSARRGGREGESLTDTNRLVPLGDPRSLQVRVAGYKAARLAAAVRAGLPVPAGFVVPAEVGRPALELGARLLAEGGSGHARLAIARMKLEPRLVQELKAAGRALGDRLAVRSSSPLDASDRWAGAFASYLEIRPEELPTAIRGCWASAFTEDALGRADRAEIRPDTVSMATLVQRELEPAAGGKAELTEDGWVTVSGASGSPARLMSGWEPGWRVRIGPEGQIEGEEWAEDMQPVALGQLARLTRLLRHTTGDDLVEWVLSEGRMQIVQCGRHQHPAPDPPPPISFDLELIGAHRVARLVSRFPGPVGEALVLPWALALEDVPLSKRRRRVRDPAGALQEAEILAGRLAAATWGLPEDRALIAARAAIGALRGPRPAGGMKLLEALTPAQPRAVRRLMATLEGVAHRLVGRGAVAHAEAIWSLSLPELRRAASGDLRPIPPGRSVPGRWEPFLFGVASTFGAQLGGAPAAVGMAAGPLHRLTDPESPARPAPRAVLAVDLPFPRLSPFLWDAAALVCRGGGEAAHLFEVARSLGVPALVGCDHRDVPDGALVAVDGAAGWARWVAL